MTRARWKPRAAAVAFVASLAIAPAADFAAPIHHGEPPPPQEVSLDVHTAAIGDLDVLTGIEFVPSQQQLQDVLGPAPSPDLIAIARGDDVRDDPGLRLRAYRALALYPSIETEQALAGAIADHGAGDTPMDNLYLRAAMDSMADVAGADGVDDIAPHLSHHSRDVRAAAARALAACGSPVAIPLLRSRLNLEPEEQVRTAISKAIRALDAP